MSKNFTDQKGAFEAKALAESKKAAEWRLIAGENASLETIPEEYVASTGDYISDEEDEELRVFAHLHLDPRLAGSHLQGSNFSVTSRYILESLKTFAAENPELAVKANIKRSIEKMELLFKDLVDNERLIEDVAHKFATNPPQVSYSSKSTAERVAELQKDHILPVAENIAHKLFLHKSIIFRTGWEGVPEFGVLGHVMVCQITETGDGSYELIIYNTGGGIPKYHNRESLVKDKYQPIIAYKLSATNSYAIPKIVTELITPCIAPALESLKDDMSTDQAWPLQRIYNADRIYKIIEDAIQKNTGIASKYENPIDALHSGPIKLLTQGQLAGTCAMQVIIPLLKANMGSEVFQVFDHQLKVKSIQKLFEFQKAKYDLNNKMANRMLLNAIRRRQLKIDKLLDRGDLKNFSKEQLAKQFDELENLKVKLKAKTQEKVKEKNVLERSKISFAKQTSNRLSSLKKDIHVTFKSHSENYFPEKSSPEILQNHIFVTNASGFDYVYPKTEPDPNQLIEGYIYLWMEKDRPFWIMKGFPKTEITMAACGGGRNSADFSFGEVLKKVQQKECYGSYIDEYFERNFKISDKQNKYKLTFKEQGTNIVKSIIIDENPKTKKLLDLINKVKKVHRGYDTSLNSFYNQDPNHPERQHAQNINDKMLVQEIYKLVRISNGEISISGKTTKTISVDTKSRFEEDVIGPQEMKTLKDFPNPLELFKTFYQTCHHNDKNGYSEVVMHQIEELFLSIPLDTKGIAAFFGSLSSEQAKEALGYLQFIIRIYGKNCYNLNPYPSAIQGITSVTGLVMANYLMNQFYNHDDDFSIAAALALPEPGEILKTTKISTVSMDPRFDKRLEELRTITETIQSKAQGISCSPIDYHDITFIKKRMPRAIMSYRQRIYESKNHMFDELDDGTKLRNEYDTYLQFLQLSGECLRIEKSAFKMFEKINSDIGNAAEGEKIGRLNSLYSEKSPGGDAHIVHYKQERYIFTDQLLTSLSYPRISGYYWGGSSELDKQQTHQEALKIKDKFVEDLIYSQKDLSSNELLLKAQKAFKQNQTEGRSRSLPFASRIPQLSVIKMKDYFESNLDDLNKEDYQKWLLFNFFAPNNLLKLFEYQIIGQDLHHFVQTALKHHSRTKNLTEGGIFIFEFCYFLKKYCSNMPGMEWLPSIEKHLGEKIESQAQISNITNTNKLLQIQFLNKTLDTQPLSKNELQTLLKTVLIVREPNYLFDLELFRAKQKIKPRLEAAFNALTEEDRLKLVQDVLPERFKTLKIEKFKFPLVILQGNHKIDLSLGKIESPLGVLSYLPKEIVYNDTFIRLFGSSITEAMKKVVNGDAIYEFLDQDNRPFKIIRKHNGEIHFQTIPINERDWFELVDSRAIDTVNNCYKDADCIWWREVSPSKDDFPKDYCIKRSIIKKESQKENQHKAVVQKAPLNKYLLRVERDESGQTAIELEPISGVDTGYVLLPHSEPKNSPFYKLFSQFESRENISIFGNTSPNVKPVFRVKFPRYNLEWIGNINQKGELEFVWAQNPDFKLDLEQINFVDDFPNFLGMINEKTKERIVIMPRQEFFIENIENKDGEYYLLNYDINNSVADEVSIRYNVNISNITSTNSQKYDLYLLKGETLEANTSEGYLQLAYIYLAKHDPENAIKTLRKCAEIGIRGTETEISLIKNIMDGVPSKKHNQAYHSLARTNEPETIAARLLAAYILTQQKQKSFNKFIQDESLSPTTQNRELLRAQIEDFYTEGFDQEVQNLYDQYRKVQGLIPEQYQLNYDQRQLLLESIISSFPISSTPAQRNELSTLELLSAKEQRALMVKNHKKAELGKQKINTADLKRLEAANAQIRDLNAELDVLRRPKLKEDVISLFGKDTLAQLNQEREIVGMNQILPDIPNKQLSFEDTLKGTDNIPNFSVLKTEINKLHAALKEFRAKTVKGFNYKTFEERAKERIELEKVLGRAENQTTARKNKIFMEYLTSSKRAEMKAYFSKLALSFNKEKAVDEIVILANYAINGTRDEKLGLKKLLTFEDLLWLYLQGDKSLFARQTRITDPSKIEALYQQIHQFLLSATEQQQYQRILKHIAAMENISDAALRDPANIEVLSDLGNELSAKREYDPRLHSEMLIFELLENKLIRRNQAEVIERMMKKTEEGYENNIYQLIMAFGKSKLLNVIMALKRADGTNLSVIEFPQSLFHASFADLRAKTFKLFGKSGFAFLFDRDTDCKSQYLLRIYKALVRTMRNRDYIATTPESMKSLQLKYLELTKKDEATLSKGLSNEERLQIVYLENILKLFKGRGDVLIDECDTALAYNKELNYPILSEPKPVPAFVASGTLKIFDCFDKVRIQMGEERFTLKDVMLGKNSITTDKKWEEALAILADKLFEEKPSYFSFLKEGDVRYKEYRELITGYILRTIKDRPEYFKTLPPREQEMIDLARGDLELLKSCLQKKAGVDYGFPLKADFKGSKELAIPYFSSAEPNYRARKSLYETMILTIILQNRKVAFEQGLTKEIVEKFINDFKLSALNEITDTEGLNFEDTVAFKKFVKLTGGLSLSDIERDANKVQKLSNIPKVFNYILHKYILSENTEYDKILKATNINHISQFRSASGFSGTPAWNGYHEKMHLNEEDNLGIDGTTMSVIEDKNPDIVFLKGKDPSYILDATLLQDPDIDKIRAFIDIGALFEGRNNIEIARLIAQKLNSRQDNAIKYVLFFNENKEFCALPLDGRDIIVIGSTDPDIIKAKTNSELKDLFAYYSQTETTAIDIKLEKDTKGVVTADLGTRTRDCLQGVMRLRSLNAAQTFKFALPERLRTLKPGKENWNWEDVIDLLEQYNNKAEVELKTAIENMKNAIRDFCLYDRMMAAESVAEKVMLRSQFDSAFETAIAIGPSEKFRQTEIRLKTSDILQKHLKLSLEKLKHLNKNLTPEEEDRMLIKLTKIMNQSLRKCAEYGAELLEMDSEIELEKEKEKEKEKEMEREQESEVWDKGIRLLYHKSWNNTFPIPLNVGAYSTQKDDRDPIKVETLSIMLGSNPGISKNILVSENYLKTYTDQQDSMDGLIKPLDFFLALKDKHNNIKILCITQEEAVEFMNYINSDQGRKNFIEQGYSAWVISNHNALLCGTSNTIPKTPEYRSLLSQVQYFNGDIDLLSRDKNFDWLLEGNTLGKLDVLKKRILPNYPEKARHWEMFRRNIRTSIAQKFAQSQINLDFSGIFKAIRNDNEAIGLKDVSEYLETLRKISDNNLRALVFNLTTIKENKQNLSPLTLSIKLGKPEFVKLILKTVDNFNFPSIHESPLLIAIQNNRGDLLNAFLITDNRLYPENTNTFDWQVLFDQMLKTQNQEIILKFITMMKKNAHPSVVESVINNVSNRITKGLISGENIFKALHTLSGFIDTPISIYESVIKKALNSSEPAIVVNILNGIRSNLKQLESDSLKKYFSDQLYFEIERPEVLEYMLQNGFLKFPDNITELDKTLVKYLEPSVAFTLYDHNKKSASNITEPTIKTDRTYKGAESLTLYFESYSDNTPIESAYLDISEKPIAKPLLQLVKEAQSLKSNRVYLPFDALQEISRLQYTNIKIPRGNLNVMLSYIFNLEETKKTEILKLLSKSKFVEIFINHILSSKLKVTDNKNYKLIFKNLPVTSPVWAQICNQINDNYQLRDELEMFLLEVLIHNKKTLKEDQFLLNILHLKQINRSLMKELVDFDFKQPSFKRFGIELLLYLTRNENNRNNWNLSHLELMFKNGFSLENIPQDKFNTMMSELLKNWVSGRETLDFIMKECMKHPKLAQLFLDSIVTNHSWEYFDVHFKLLSDSLDKLSREQKILILNKINFNSWNRKDPKTFDFAFKIVGSDALMLEALRKIFKEKQIHAEIAIVDGSAKFIETSVATNVPKEPEVRQDLRRPPPLFIQPPSLSRYSPPSSPQMSPTYDMAMRKFNIPSIKIGKMMDMDMNKMRTLLKEYGIDPDLNEDVYDPDLLENEEDVLESEYDDFREPKERSPKSGKSPKGRKSKHFI